MIYLVREEYHKNGCKFYCNEKFYKTLTNAMKSYNKLLEHKRLTKIANGKKVIQRKKWLKTKNGITFGETLFDCGKVPQTYSWQELSIFTYEDNQIYLTKKLTTWHKV